MLQISKQATYSALPRTFRDAAARNPNAVLLETSRFDATNHHSYLFLNPTRLIVADRLEDIPRLFQEIEIAIDEGRWLAGYLCYECGYHFDKLPGVTVPRPLAWFGVYDRVEVFDHVRTGQGPGHAGLEEDGFAGRCEPIAAS